MPSSFLAGAAGAADGLEEYYQQMLAREIALRNQARADQQETRLGRSLDEQTAWRQMQQQQLDEDREARRTLAEEGRVIQRAELRPIDTDVSEEEYSYETKHNVPTGLYDRQSLPVEGPVTEEAAAQGAAALPNLNRIAWRGTDAQRRKEDDQQIQRDRIAAGGEGTTGNLQRVDLDMGDGKSTPGYFVPDGPDRGKYFLWRNGKVVDVSAQAKMYHVPDRVIMSVADPNNPGNNVLTRRGDAPGMQPALNAGQQSDLNAMEALGKTVKEIRALLGASGDIPGVGPWDARVGKLRDWTSVNLGDTPRGREIRTKLSRLRAEAMFAQGGKTLPAQERSLIDDYLVAAEADDSTVLARLDEMEQYFANKQRAIQPGTAGAGAAPGATTRKRYNPATGTFEPF